MSQRHIYTFKNTCVEDSSLSLPDGTTKIFLSTKGKLDDIPADLKAFLDYVDGIMSDDDLVQDIDSTIKDLKLQEAERVSYMTFAMKLLDERKIGHEEGRREGHREGLREGHENTLLANIQNLMATMHLSALDAMDALRVPAEERKLLEPMLQ